jgi:hypothetical protein
MSQNLKTKFVKKCIKILFFCDMTQCHCAIYSRRFQTTNLSWHFRNREAGDVASYLKRKEPSQKPLREYTNFIFRATLKWLTFLSGSSGYESQFYSAAARYEMWLSEVAYRLKYTRLSSVSPFS